MAIVPRFQGQGLGKPLLTATCNRLIELQHRRACLSTETVRRAAIHLYLKFGFLPEIRNRHDRLAWRDLQQQGLAIPAQATLPRSALD